MKLFGSIKYVLILCLFLVTGLYAIEDSVHTFNKQFGLGYATSVAFSPKGDTYAISSCDGNVRIYNTENQLLKTLESGSSSACILANWSLDGRYLVSSQYENSLVIWDTSQTTPLQRASFDINGINALTFTVDQKILVASDKDSTVILWNINENKIESRWESLSLGREPLLSPGGTCLVTDLIDAVDEGGSNAYCKKMYTLKTPVEENVLFWSSDIKSVNTLFNGDGTLLAIDSAEVLKVIKPGTLETVYQVPILGSVLAFTQDDTVLVSSTGDSLYEYCVTTSSVKSVLPYEPNSFYFLDSDINENLDVVHTTFYDPFLYKVKTGKKDTLSDYTMVTNFCGLSSDNKYAVMNGINGIEVFDCSTGKLVKTLQDSTNIRVFSFSKMSSFLLTTSYDEIKFWDMNSGFTKIIKDDARDHYAAEFSPQQKHILYSYGSRDSVERDSSHISLYDYENDSILYTVSHPKRGYAWLKCPLKFSGDGSHFGILLDNAVYVHNATTGEKVYEFVADSGSYISDFDLNHSGTTLMVGDGSGNSTPEKYSTKAALIDLQTMDTLQTYSGLMYDFLTIEFHPNDSLVLFGGWGEAILCDVHSGNIISRIMGSVRGGGFSEDGSLIYAVGTTLRLWDITTGEAVLKSNTTGTSKVFSLLGVVGKTMHFSLPGQAPFGVKVTLFDVRGRVLQSGPLHLAGRRGSLTLEKDLGAGQYFYSIEVDNKNIQNGRFTVR